MEYETIANRYLTQGYTDIDLANACENAMDCLIDCHGQSLDTVQEWSHTVEGNKLFIKYFIASMEG